MAKFHVIVDFYGANPSTLAKTDELKVALLRACKSLDIAIEKETFYQFEPEGVTATVASAELHFNIHTWPEFGSCAIDLYSQREHDFTVLICEAFKRELQATEYDMKILARV